MDTFNDFITNNIFLAWCTIVSTLIGVISLVASIKAVINTKTISNALKRDKMNNAFKKEYKVLLSTLSTHIVVLTENNTSDTVIYALYETISKIKTYADSVDWDDKKIITDTYNFMDENITKFKNNIDLYTKLKKHIIKIKTIIEKEGKII